MPWGADPIAPALSEVLGRPRISNRRSFVQEIGFPTICFSIGTAQFRITDRNGRNLSADARLDDLQQARDTYSNNETLYLTRFWYDQQFLGGKLNWKIGRHTEAEDFAAFSCEFMNFTFCGSAPGYIVGSYRYNWKVSQWATRVKVSVSGFGYVQLGVFEVNPRSDTPVDR